nr:phytanoyl- dioxygenase family protein [Colletotrichum truncatum]KAF6781287.1 phytanoyl- dioxygenase family protein [Colletotrichum truncatum]
MNDERDARHLIRAYSFEAEERLTSESGAHSLAHILAENQGSRDDALDPWRRFFEPPEMSDGARYTKRIIEQTRSYVADNIFRDDNPITKVLAVETAELRNKWKAFVESSPAADRLNLQTSEPTMDGVIDTVQQIQKSWEAKRGNGRLAKAKRFFHKFCSTLDSHKLLIQILPSGNEYVSIFTGTLNVVIQASANHEKVAEGLSEALCAMSQHVNACKTDLEMFNMEDMQSLIAELYAHIFLLLTSVMDWMMKKRLKRLLDSFNDDLPSVFENEMGKIKAISDRIRNLAAQKARAELRSTRITAESSASMLRDIRVGLEGDRRHQAEMRHFAESILREQMRSSDMWAAEKRHQLAVSIVDMLKEEAIGLLEARRAAPNQMRTFQTATTALSLGGSAERVTEYTSDGIIMISLHLEDFFHRDRVRLSGDELSPVMIQPEAYRYISDWVSASAPKILWIEGEPLEADDLDNPVTMMAARIAGIAEKTKVPVISYFCELRRGEKLRPGNDSKETQAMLSLVYALIRQLIELLPPVLETSADLTESRFQSLDGSLATWSSATSILAELIALMPGPVFCIIDAFHWLNDRSTGNYLSDLLRVLRGNNMKVLLFTTGRSVALRDELLRSETFSLDARQSFRHGVALDRQSLSGISGGETTPLYSLKGGAQ